MIWSVVKLALGPVAELGKRWMKGRKAKSDAKIAIQARIATGQIDYNVAAQKGMAASLKDEFLVVWFTGIMTLNFVPSMQDTMKDGWIFINANVPGWFSYCFIGMVVATFGLKGYKGWMNGNGKKVKE